MKDANVVFGSVGSSSWRRSFHEGSIFILWFFSSYLMMPCLDRRFESLVSLLVWRSSWSDSSSMLCHAPFLMAVKNSSMLKVLIYCG